MTARRLAMPPRRRRMRRGAILRAPTAPTRGRGLFRAARGTWTCAARRRPPDAALLDLDLGALLLEGCLDLLGLFLGDAFLDGLGRSIDEVLGLLEAEAGELAYDLDDRDLV